MGQRWLGIRGVRITDGQRLLYVRGVRVVGGGGRIGQSAGIGVAVSVFTIADRRRT
jgi:hypothetical protein